MKVRTKFTVLISLVSCISVVFFTSNIYLDIREEIHESIDYELADVADHIFSKYENIKDLANSQHEDQPELLRQEYWLKVDSNTAGTLLRTRLAQLTPIPPASTDEAYIVSRSISTEHFKIPPAEMDEIYGDRVNFRVRMFRRQIGDETITIQIAKPLLLWDLELHELLFELFWSLLLTVLLILTTAYLVAGKLLRPISIINRRITQIRENSLNTRIPLGKSEDELYELSSSLNSMFDRLEHSFARQKEFVGNAAHEMKSPLTILMLGHEEMLSGNIDKNIRPNLEKQLYSMQRLNKLIRDLLSIARLEQQDTLHRSEFDLSKLIAGILEDYSEVIREKQIVVSSSLPSLMVNADQEKFLRLFINLIDNAIKYTYDRNGSLEIIGKRNGDSVVVSVSNSGNAIPPADITNIFNQFYRVEKSRSQAYGGSGLGLTIARRIVEMHGGTIAAQSNENHTSFTITLPVDR